jgi:hypothetical protein
VYKNKKLIEQQAYFSGKGEGINAPGLEISHVFQQMILLSGFLQMKGCEIKPFEQSIPGL